MAITDLTGTVWYLNSSPSSALTKKYINFYSNNKLWKLITCDKDQNQQNYYYGIHYNGTTVYDDVSGGWNDVNYRKIYIVDGTDVTNSTLITWLQTNAGLITTSNEYITYANDMNFVAQAIRAKGNTSSGLNYPLGFVTAIQNIPTGGNTNVVQGTFTTPSTTGAASFTIPYSGRGYPIALTIYIDGGPYNNTSSGNTTWYNIVQRYAIGVYNMVKTEITTAPTYATTGAANYGTVQTIYKNSTSTATSYSRTSSMTANTYANYSGVATSDPTACVRFKGNKTTVSYYVASSSYGLLASTKYAYVAVYSS